MKYLKEIVNDDNKKVSKETVNDDAEKKSKENITKRIKKWKLLKICLINNLKMLKKF